MKIPKYVIRIGGREYVVASNQGIATLMKLMEEAIPVSANFYSKPPEIELDYWNKPDVVSYLQEVSCRKIPANTRWKRKGENGEVEIIRPVAKKPKALPAPKAKALPGSKRPQLKPREPQLALGFGGLS